MNKSELQQLHNAVQVLRGGGIIAYPTESMYGLGCDPFNENAVKKLLAIKNRTITRGLILIIANWHQAKIVIAPITKEQFILVNKSWPGNNTWLFPKKEKIPYWLTGDFETIALRMPDHLLARTLAEYFGSPIVSTSANISDKIPCRTSEEVKKVFSDQIDCIVEGSTGSYTTASQIRDLLTKQVIRN